jgi:GT2 family glycosyltransferase
MRTAPSSGGTSEAIAEQFPDATVYDYYLRKNDDTSLDDGGLAVLLDTARQLRERGGEAVIVAGSTRHTDPGELTYGGVVHPYRWRPLRAELVEPGDAPRPCDATNGNATLISRAVVQRIGNIDPAIVQQMGDFDYGLRLRAAGCSVWVAPGTVGTFASHPERRPDERSLGEELRRLWSLKQLKPGPWAVCCRRWAGRLWTLYWLSPYVRGGIRMVLQRIPPARRGAL